MIRYDSNLKSCFTSQKLSAVTFIFNLHAYLEYISIQKEISHFVIEEAKYPNSRPERERKGVRGGTGKSD